MTNAPAEVSNTRDASIPTMVTPQVLLTSHFKTLKLPTFAREYEKVGIECAHEDIDYARYLLRLCELECIDRERRNLPAHTSGKIPGN